MQKQIKLNISPASLTTAFVFTLLIPFLFSCRQPVHFDDQSAAPEPYNYLSGSEKGKKVKASSDPLVAWRWDNPKASDELEIYTLRPVSVSSEQASAFHNLNSLTRQSGRITVRDTGSIMFDFGQENAAWLEFESDDLNGEIEMSISEYNEPCILNYGAQNRIKTLAPVKYGNTYRLELNDELYEGVRFGWIHIRSVEAPFHIQNVRLVCQIRPTNYEGSFDCSDPVLNRIWYAGAYGVKLNLLKDFFGAILMERSDRFSWTGDAYTSQAASLVAFGNFDFVLTNLHHTADQNNGILSYSMYWIQSLTDYYYHTGDTTTLIQYIDNASTRLDKAYEHYGTNPNLSFYGWDERLGAGFENHSCKENQNAYKMLCIESWTDFAKMLRSIDRNKLALKYENYAHEKIEILRQDTLWYSDFGVHAASDAINAGFTNNKEQEFMYSLEFSDRLNRLSYSPFNQYFIIQAMAKMGKYDEAIAAIKDSWGGQLKYGGTTFFEVFRPSWNEVLQSNDAPINAQCGPTSLCHPWGGGVVKWLTEEILGIRATSPGFNKCDIMPHPGRSLSRVKGSVPTPHGIISAEYNLAKGLCKMDIPHNVTAKIGIPRLEKEISLISLNGKIVYKNGEIVKNQTCEIQENDEYILFYGMKEGQHAFKFEYRGDTPEFQDSEWVYPAKFAGEDCETSGNWGGKYGSDGYVLCAYKSVDNKLSDLQKLPEYIKNISYNKQLEIQWAKEVNDSRAPAASPANKFPRNVGAIYTRDPLATWQTMTIDIEMESGIEKQFALYFVDWDDSGRRLAVEIFDLETSKLIAPVKMVRDYANGKYLIYKYNRSVRFRINQVRGPNVTLSGIFFDPA